MTKRHGVQSIVEELRAQIESGELPAGEVLPSTRDLMDRYGVAKEAVRGVLARLKDLGLVEVRQGARARIAARPRLKRAGMARYAKSMWANGIPAFAVDREATGRAWAYTDQTNLVDPTTEADEEIAAALGLQVGDRVVARQRTVREGETITHVLTSYYRPEDVEGTPIMDARPGTAGGAGGGYAILTEKGLEPDECLEELEVSLPSREQQAALGCRPTQPIVYLRRIVWTEGGRVVEYARGPHRADHFSWSYRFKIPK